MVVVSVLMLLAHGSVPGLAAQEVAAPNADTASGYQYGPQPGPPVQPGVCGHAPGEFLVVYESEAALRAAPQENVVDTIDGILAQLVVYGGIKGEPDPAKQRDAEEAAKKELEARPGVSYVEYNCTVSAEASAFAGAAQAAAARALPADCGECGGNIGRLASEIIGGGSEGSDGKNAYQAALSAARSAGLEENVALASETGEEDAGDDPRAEPAAGEDGEAGGDNVETGGSEKGTDDEAGVVEGDAAETAAETPDAGEEKDAGGEADASQEKDAGEKTTSAGGSTAGGVTPGDARGGENASANGGGLGGSPLVALGGGVLLVAGLFMARKIFGG